MLGTTKNHITVIHLVIKKLQRPLKGEKVNLIENGKNISNDTKLCNIFNGFFSNIISQLNIPKKYHYFLNDMDSDSVLSVLKALENHPSIKNIISKNV